MTARIDTISTIHKAIRKILFDHAMLLARTDFDSETAAMGALEATRQTLACLREHGAHEDASVFPIVATHDPALAAEAARQHGALEAGMHEIEHLAAAVAVVTPGERVAAARRLRSRFEQLVADQLRHLAFEESEINAALWAAMSDAQLRELHGKIQAAIPPERAVIWRELLLASADARERKMLAA